MLYEDRLLPYSPGALPINRTFWNPHPHGLNQWISGVRDRAFVLKGDLTRQLHQFVEGTGGSQV
jgi:hypothetical protein